MQTEKEQDFIRLIEQNKDLIWHVCQDYSLSAAWTTEDLFQEVVCKIWKCMGQYQGRSAERTWIYRIATNTLLEIKRKKSNQPMPDAPQPDARSVPSPAMSDLEQVIASLGEPERTIVRASLDGFDYKEIAQITQLTTGAVAMKLLRAKEKIKQILNHE